MADGRGWYRRYHKPIWLIGAKSTNRVLKFFAFAYLARVLGADSFGVLTFALFFMLPFASLADFGFELTGNRMLSRYPEMQTEIVARIVKLRVLAGSLTYIAMVLCTLLMPGAEKVRPAILLFGIMLFFNEVSFHWPFYASEEYQEVGLANLLNGVVVLAGIWLLVRDTEAVYIAILIMVFGALIEVGYLVVQYLRKYRRATSVDSSRLVELIGDVRTTVKEAVPLAMGGTLFVLYLGAIPLLIGFLLTTRAVGIFSVAFQIPRFFAVLALTLANAVLIPSASRAYPDILANPAHYRELPGWRRLERRFRAIVLAVLLLAVLTVPFLLVFADVFIKIFYGSEYVSATVPFIVLTLSALLGLLSICYMSLLPAFNRDRTYLWAVLAQIVFIIAIGWPLINLFGLIGGAYSVLGSQVFTLLFVLLYLRGKGLAPLLR